MDQFQQLPPDEQPLSPANYREINAALATLHRAARKIERAKEAGANCDDPEGMCRFLEDRLNKLKQVYFANKP